MNSNPAIRISPPEFQFYGRKPVESPSAITRRLGTDVVYDYFSI